MRPVFLWSDWGSTTFLAHHLKRAGVPVTLYIHHETHRMAGTGYVPKTTDPMPPKDALVIFDGIGHGDLGTTLRKRGNLVIGGNPYDKDLEAHRYDGIKIMQQAGIQTPPTKNFTSIGAARTFLEQADGDWFVKVSGTTVDEASTCNADKETLLRYLTYIATQPGDKSFVLQQKVDGVEVSTDGWFDGVKFVPPFDATFEEKKLLAGNLGPRTGCENCVVWMYSEKATLPQETVGKIEEQLREHRYVGPVDLNAIVGKDGTVYGLEWTARLGFDATQAWVRFFEPKQLVEQLEAFAARMLMEWEMTHREHKAFTVRVTVPPYPNGTTKELGHMKGWPADPKWVSGASYDPEDLMRGEGGPVVAGASGMVGVISEHGPNFRMLCRDVLAAADDLRLPSKQYRIDPLERAEDDWDTLKKLGKL